ncbi:hypothetical protein ACFQU2_10550 [Siccirubricoccus deserti]
MASVPSVATAAPSSSAMPNPALRLDPGLGLVVLQSATTGARWSPPCRLNGNSPPTAMPASGPPAPGPAAAGRSAEARTGTRLRRSQGGVAHGRIHSGRGEDACRGHAIGVGRDHAAIARAAAHRPRLNRPP